MQLTRRSTIWVISTALLALAFCMSLSFVIYRHAKKSYWLVGFNDGKIQANIDLITKFREIDIIVGNCHEILKDGVEITELLAAKDQAIYVVKSNSSTHEFCEYK